MGAGKTAFAQGFGRALGVTEPITSPTFTLVHSYETAGVILHHADLYRLDQLAEVADLGLAELAEHHGIVLVEWGDVVESTFGEHLIVELSAVDDDEEARILTIGAVGPGWSRRWSTLCDAVERLGVIGADAHDEPPMLILGIETATEQVSVALGGHEGVIALFEVARGRRHAEILTPAVEFVCAQADIGLDELGLIAVDVGPGLFTGMRVGLSAAQGAGVRAAPADDRHLVTRSPGLPPPAVRSTRRPRHRRPKR